MAGLKWAEQLGVKVARFPADWDTYGKRAGYLRNEQMAEYADALFAIWDGESKGTKHMIDIMLSKKKPVYVEFA
jgi:alkanesulfonate monooxygenase SsuD/methylene tetrahydromethanopterin reductase-like flavin-dependent oxidoreductase (luciferase family)